MEDITTDEIITVSNINNSHLHLDVTNSVSRELSDYFSFMLKNAKFMPAVKAGRFDGKIRLYKIMGSTLPAGLFEILLKFASDNDYTVIDERVQSKYSKPTESELSTFLSELNVHSRREKITHYDYQENAVFESIKNERATILSSTSSGKSLIIYSIIRWYQNIVPGKILLIVPTVNLVAQMFTDFEDYASETEWMAEDHVHKIHQGQEKNSDKQVYISTWQSVHKMPKYYFDQFDVVMCDEVHGADAKSITTIMENCINASIRLGFTGTLKDSKLHKLAIIGLFGDIKKITSSRELMDRGIIANFNAKFMVLKYNQTISKEINRKIVESVSPTGKKNYRNNYQNEMSYIASCHERNIFIANLVSILKGNALVLFTKIDKHGKPLHGLFKKRLDKKKNLYYISGETKVDERERIRNALENEDNCVLTASYGTLSTGVNIRNLKYVIFASPYKSEIKVLQSIGRLLRKGEGKTKAVLFDIVDDFRYKKYVNYSFKHFVKRYDIYKNEKFPLSVSEYNLI